MRVVVAAVMIAAFATGCDDNGQKYSRSDVERAFRSQGLGLFAPNRPSVLDKESMLLLVDSHAVDPPTAKITIGNSTLVLIYKDAKDATDAIKTIRSQEKSVARVPHIGRFELQKGNVVVSLYERMTAPMRKRIRDALAELG